MVAFAFTLGIEDAWPLVLQHSGVFVAQIIIIFEIARIEKIEAARAGNE